MRRGAELLNKSQAPCRTRGDGDLGLRYIARMGYELLQATFEWFVTRIWDRHGPVAGMLAIAGFLLTLTGLAYFVVTNFW